MLPPGEKAEASGAAVARRLVVDLEQCGTVGGEFCCRFGCAFARATDATTKLIPEACSIPRMPVREIHKELLYYYIYST